MKTFNFNAPNPFVNKTYTVEKGENNTSKINVKSAFLGTWSFEVPIDYETICTKMNTYCNTNNAFIQNVFPELSPAQRENFLTDPRMGLFKN